MALKHGSDHFTKWMHMENGQVMVRRIHRMEIQDACGRLHTIIQDQLPEAVVTSTGEGQKGKHIARILLRPQSRTLAELPAFDGLPGAFLWNAMMFGLGFFSALTLRYFARLLIEF